MTQEQKAGTVRMVMAAVAGLALLAGGFGTRAQGPRKKSAATEATRAGGGPARPKLVVLIVVDQMRADYVDRFQSQWRFGLKRLVKEGAWFRNAAYPYAATETCVGHATISTGAFPATHGIVANAWWDRDTKRPVTCTDDPAAKNIGYGDANVEGQDTAWRLRVPTFADELRIQSGGGAHVLTISLKARAAIMMAGHAKDSAVTWFDEAKGAWVTSSAYGTRAFVDEYAKRHSVKEDYGKTWIPSLPANAYLYDDTALGTVPAVGWGPTLPHPLRGKEGLGEPDETFYKQWEMSPFADTYLTKMGMAAVDALGLWNTGETDFLGISYSSVDYAGHAFGPRSWEIQDILVSLDNDLGELFAHLDAKTGKGNYVVALSADHGVVPMPEDMQKLGANAGELHLPEVQRRIDKVLEVSGFPEHGVAKIMSGDVYFGPGVYEKLKADGKTMRAVIDAAKTVEGVAEVYRAEELADRPATKSPIREALADSYLEGRSGDLLIVPKPYWLPVGTPVGKPRSYGTGHGTPYGYDQRVPILLMGWGIQPGEYFQSATPADIAPTLASLCGITLASRDGRVLAEALRENEAGAPKKR